MRVLQDINLSGATVIEHRADGNVHGPVAYSGVNGDGSFVVGWSQTGCGNRTTIFQLSSWSCEVIAGVVFLRRKAQDSGNCDVPWRDANSYTIVPAPQSSRR